MTRPPRRRSEPTLPGNPNKLIRNQHVFPVKAIERFAGPGGLVQVQRLAGTQPFSAKPDDAIFCADRVWDQGTETYRTHPIEIAWAQLAEEIANGKKDRLAASDAATATEFYALWTARHLARKYPGSDQLAQGLVPEPDLTKAEEEVLELKGALFFRAGNMLPARLMWSAGLRILMDQIIERQQLLEWGIVRSAAGDFIVPDNSCETPLLPVTPKICLVLGQPSTLIGADTLGQLNRRLVDQADTYYFAMDLERAPILRRSIPLGAAPAILSARPLVRLQP